MCSGAHSVLTFTLVGARFWDKNATWWNRGNSTGRFGVTHKGSRYRATFNYTNLGTYVDLDEAAKAVDVEVRKSRSHGSKLSFPTEAEKELLQRDLLLRSPVQQANFAALKQFAALNEENEKKLTEKRLKAKEICVCENKMGRIPGRSSNNRQICQGRRNAWGEYMGCTSQAGLEAAAKKAAKKKAEQDSKEETARIIQSVMDTPVDQLPPFPFPSLLPNLCPNDTTWLSGSGVFDNTSSSLSTPKWLSDAFDKFDSRSPVKTKFDKK